MLNRHPVSLSGARLEVASLFPAEIADEAALVLSELVSNAFLHALPGDVRVIAQLDRFGARLVVADPGPSHEPDARAADEHGWGGAIVEELSDRTGQWNAPTGHHIVWAAWDLA